MSLDGLLTLTNVDSEVKRLGRSRLGFGVYGDEILANPYFTEEERAWVLARGETALLPIGRVRGVDGQIFAMFKSPAEMSGGFGSELHEHLVLAERIADVIALPTEREKFKIGWAGQTPAYVARTNTPTESSYISGVIGSVATCIISNHYFLKEVVKQEIQDSILGFCGLGTIGRPVHAYHAREGAKRVIGYDPRFAMPGRGGIRGNRVLTGSPEDLGDSDTLMNAAPYGDAARPIIQNLKEGVVWGSETHPREGKLTMEEIINKGSLYMVGVGWPGIYLEPNLPGRISEEIPGCLLETIAAVLLGFETRDIQEFIVEVTGSSEVAYLEQKVTSDNIDFYAITS